MQTGSLNYKHLALCTLTVLTIFGLFSNPSWWRLVIGPLHSDHAPGYPFADMNGRLGAAEGVGHGIDVNNEFNPYSNFGGLNNKPLYTLHVMAMLGLDRSDTKWMGIFWRTLHSLESLVGTPAKMDRATHLFTDRALSALLAANRTRQ